LFAVLLKPWAIRAEKAILETAVFQKWRGARENITIGDQPHPSAFSREPLP
jgi:hypothetical protein